ncbi:MAG: sn-glycerol-3-phosphate ABC transporter permease UgpA [Azospirillum sp.]|nr:sn-glycerol-3-phosphate ABC transporter permease UgpA [Azospirillum sp.]
MDTRVVFRARLLPYLLLLPQLMVTAVFFLWPASQALVQSMLLQDPFGLKTQVVWFANFTRLFADSHYLEAFGTTAVFSISVAVLSLGLAMLLAAVTDRVIRGKSLYRSLLIWPYAVAPVVSGVLWMFLFGPSFGLITWYLRRTGIEFNHLANGNQAMALVVIAAAWKQVSYNFVFLLAGLQAIPQSLIEAAAIDGAGPLRRFVTIVLPLLAPTTFFLTVVNLVYAFFETFGVIHAVTQGGPGQSTAILVYKVYHDGFEGLDLGSSAAQSVILMAVVTVLTVIQFRFVERRVHYS